MIRIGRPLQRWPLAAAIATGATLSGILDAFDLAIVDWRNGQLNRPVSGDLVLVGIDAKSIAALEQWPWPRRHHARVIENLLDAGARRIAIDIDFSSRSNPIDDAALAAALARGGARRIALPFFSQLQPTADGGALRVQTLPHPRFLPLVAPVHANAFPDPDGLLRHYPTGAVLGDQWRPSLAGWAIQDGSAVSDDARGPPLTIDFGLDVQSIPYVSFVDVLEGRFEPAWFRGLTVFVGATDISLGDIVATPRHAALPGVVVHALAAETMLQDRSLSVLGAAPMAGLVAALLVVGRHRLERLPWPWAVVATSCGLVLANGLAALGHFWFAWTFPLDAVIFGWLAGCGLLAYRRAGLLTVRRRAADRRAERRRRLIDGIVANSFDPIITFAAGGRILSLNPAAMTLFGTAATAVGGPPASAMVLADLLPNAATLLAKLGDARPYRCTIVLEAVARRGRRSLEAVLAAFSDAKLRDRVGVLTLRDVSEAQATRAALEHLRHHDIDSGLPNRATFELRLDEEIGQHRHPNRLIACLVIDLPGLAAVEALPEAGLGNRLILALARRLEGIGGTSFSVARLSSSALVARLSVAASSGDRLLELEPIRAICGALDEPIELDCRSLMADAVVGIGCYPRDAATAAALVRAALIAARHAATVEGARFVAYAPAIDDHLRRRFELAAALRDAVAARALDVVYQPKVSLVTGETVGLEALVRWDSDRFGAVSPQEFVPIAEEVDLVDDLTRGMLERVLADQRLLAAKGLRLPAAVNLSGRSLTAPDGGRALVEYARRLGGTPAKLAFEITETAAMREPEQAMTLLRELRLEGFEVMLDDFGTGYSSFAQLRNLPLSGVKLDRSLVRITTHDRTGTEVLASILELASRLGLKTVGEGVETRTELERLEQLGCDLAQGYLTGRPMPLPTLLNWACGGCGPSSRAAAGRPRPALARERRAGVAYMSTAVAD